MTGEQIYAQFRILCPNLVYELNSYKRVSPHTIELKSKTNKIYIFFYKSPNNFMLRTKDYKEED